MIQNSDGSWTPFGFLRDSEGLTDEDPLAPARGCLTALLIMAGLLAVVGLIALALYRALT